MTRIQSISALESENPRQKLTVEAEVGLIGGFTNGHAYRRRFRRLSTTQKVTLQTFVRL